MDILAFDPGTEKLGIALLTGDSGNKIVWAEEMNFKGDLIERFKQIASKMEQFLKLAGTPEYCALETPYVGFNPSTAIKLGIVKGIILANVFKALPTTETVDVTPQEIRRTFGLPIKSKKEQYHKIIKKHFPKETLKDLSEDGLDAVAVGLTAATKVRKDLWWGQDDRRKPL